MDTLWRLLSAAMNTAVVSVRYRPRYAAMCDALLPVIERYPHSSHVSYIPVGMDATISEAGGKDLKFINIGQDPLKIVAETNEGTMTVSIYLVSKETLETVMCMQ